MEAGWLILEFIEVFKKSGSPDPEKDLKDMYRKAQKVEGESFNLDEFVATRFWAFWSFSFHP